MANTCGNTHPDVDVDVAVAVTVAFAAYISRKINALQFARFICRRRQQRGGRGVEGGGRRLNAARCALDCRTFAWISTQHFTTLLVVSKAAATTRREGGRKRERGRGRELQMRLQVGGIFAFNSCCPSSSSSACTAWLKQILAVPF